MSPFPESIRQIENETVDLRNHPYSPGKISDGYKLCESCHKEIHQGGRCRSKTAQKEENLNV